MWGRGRRRQPGGYRLNFNGACCGTGFLLTNPGARRDAQSSREASTKVIEDTATW